MSIYGAFTHCGLFLNGLNLTSTANMVKVTATKEVRDRSVFGNTARVRVMGGLEDVEIAASGFADMSNDSDLQSIVGVVGNVSVFIPATSGANPALGDLAYFTQLQSANYQIGEAQGNDLPWTLTGFGAHASGYGLINGYVLEPGLVAKTGAGNSASFQAGAISSSQYLYGMLHVTAMNTPTILDVYIDSSPNGTDTWTPYIQFTQVTTTVTSQMAARVAGPVTDTYWRASWTMTGTSYTFAVAMGIK